MTAARKLIPLAAVITLLAAGFTVLPGGAPPVLAATTSSSPVADATVKIAHPAVNYAAEDPLHLTSKGTNKQQAYLKFAVTVNPGETVTSATLQLDFTQVQSSAVEVHSASSSWTETGITWNSQPAVGTLLDSHTVTTGLKTFTVTSAVVNGDNTFEVQAPGYAGTSDYQFKSREDLTTSLRPLLTVVTSGGTQAPPAVTTGAASSLAQTTATLNGTANPDGAATTCHFDWGTTAYGNATANDTSPGAGTTAVPVTANLTGLTAGTTYHDRLSCSSSGGTTNGADSQFTTTTAATDLLSSKLGLYNGIIGAWEGPADPPFANTTVIADQTAAKPLMTQYDTYDCFTDQTCGRDNHTGLISRASFDSEIQKITGATGYNTPLWFKLLPIAKGSVNNEPDGSQFCPPPTNWGMNLTLFKSQLDEIKAAGYTGPIVLESSNEAEFDCWAYWATFNSAITGAGSAGVSRNIGDMYAATMPALVKYARSIGFTQVVTDGYIGISGGPGWGQACTQDGTGTWGWSCGYQARWVDEFNTEVHNAYVANGNDPDYLPNAESIHAYPHGSDFTSTAGYDFPDGEAYQYYRNWLIKSRAELDTIWGAANGDSVRFAISEWNAGYSRGGTSDWAGWTTAGAPGAFYDGWYGMLQGDGNTQGAGTRYWSASLFDIASNSDTGTGQWYNYIRQDGTTPAWYANYKTASLNDPNR